eukprot:5709565-Pyramimonas_sp.AAC.1
MLLDGPRRRKNAHVRAMPSPLRAGAPPNPGPRSGARASLASAGRHMPLPPILGPGGRPAQVLGA